MSWNRCGNAWPILILLSGCATPDHDPSRSVRFTCERGRTIEVQFLNGSARIVEDGGAAITLPQRPAASGFWYESPTHALRGKGEEATYTVGRMTPMQCKVAG